MFNLNNNGFSAKILARMFRQVDGLKWDLQTGSLGVLGKDGSIATLVKTDVPAVAAVAATADTTAVAAVPASTEYNISINPFDMFSIAIPAFAIQTRLDNVKEGDLVVGAEKILGFVIGKTDKSLKLRDFDGFNKNYVPPKVQILGQDGVLVVQSLGNLFGGTGGVAGLNNLLMPLIMASGGSTEGLDSILPIVLFSQLQASNPAVASDAAAAAGNPSLAQTPIASMLPFLLMKSLGKKKTSGSSSSKGLFGDIDPMMLMLAGGGGFGGGAAGGMNPMMLMALANSGLGDDEPEAPALVSLPKTTTRGNFAPALERINKNY